MKKYSLTLQLSVLCLSLLAANSYATAPIVGYFADTYGNRVDSLGSDGTIASFSTGGSLSYPTGSLFDASGNMYVANNAFDQVSGSENILEITPGGLVSSYVSDSNLHGVRGIAFGPSNNLYAANAWAGNIVKMANPPSPSQDTYFNIGSGEYPWGLVVDSSSNIYVTDHAKSVFKITSAGVVTQLADDFNASSSITLLNGNLYVADEGTSSIPGNVTIIPTVTGPTNFGTGTPYSVAMLWSGGLLYDMTHNGSNPIFSTTQAGVTTQIASTTGGAYPNFMAGPSPTGVGYFTNGSQVQILNANGTFTSFVNLGSGSTPEGIALDSSGNIYVADQANAVIKKVTPGGTISTYASDSAFTGVYGLAMGPAGNLYVANAWSAQSIVELANPPSPSQDKYFNLPSGHYPYGVAVDSRGNIYVTDDQATPNGTVYEFEVATSSSPKVVSSGFAHPGGIVIGTDGNLYVGDDTGVHKIPIEHTFTSGMQSSAALAWATDSNLYDITQYGNQVYQINSLGQKTALPDNNGSPYVMFLAASVATTPVSAATILNGSLTANANDAVFLQGDGFGTSPKVRYCTNYGSAPSWTTLTNVSQGTYTQTSGGSSSGVTVRLPSTASPALLAFEVSADNGTSWCAPFYVNRAHGMHFDTPVVASGTVFRIFGRNLLLSGATPTVRLVDTASPFTSLNASVSTTQSNTSTSSSINLLSVTAPASGIVAGHIYTVMVSNGYNGGTSNGGETPVEATILGYSPGSNTDVLSLGVPWGCDFAPYYNSSKTVNATVSPYTADKTGSTNSLNTIQSAIYNTASNGGGVVYLPAGTYNIDFDPSHAPGYTSGGSTGGLAVPANVIIKGDGIGQTILVFSDSVNTVPMYPAVAIGNGTAVQTSGLAYLTVKNLDTAHQWQDIVQLYDYPPSSQSPPPALQQSREIVLKNVGIISASGSLFYAGPADRVAIQNCDFQILNGTFSGADAFYISGLSNFLFQNNTVEWSAGQIMAGSGGAQGIMENNTFTRYYSNPQTNNPYPQEINTRGFDIDYCVNMAIQYNTFQTSGAFPSNTNNAGETISTEQGNTNLGDSARGTVTSSTSTTLVDSSASWSSTSFTRITADTVQADANPANYSSLNYPVVMIVAGKGAGQWRYLSSSSGQTLTILGSSTSTTPGAGPWAVNPGAGSTYCVLDWSNVNWLLANNTLTGNPIGIELYLSSNDNVDIYNNTLTNNQAITLINLSDVDQSASDDRVVQQPSVVNVGPSTSTYPLSGFLPSWDSQIVNNKVYDNNGVEASFVGVSALETGVSPVGGMLELGVEVRGNTVNGDGAVFPESNAGNSSPSAHEGGNSNEPYTEGFWNMLTIESTGFQDGTPVVFGTILQNNTASNCNLNPAYTPGNFYTANNQPEPAGAYRIDSGAYLTLILNDTANSGQNKVEDSTLSVTNPNYHASVNTYTGN